MGRTLTLAMATLAILLSAFWLPAPALAQRVGVLQTVGCIQQAQRQERRKTSRYVYTDYHMEFRNVCGEPVTFYYCVSAVQDPQAACPRRNLFTRVVLAPGETTRVAAGGGNYTHFEQCKGGLELTDLSSAVSGRSRVECLAPGGATAPRPTAGSFTGMGTPPDPRAPVVTQIRNQQTLYSGDDFPASMMGTLAEGTTIVMIGVSAQGAATGCTVTQSSGYAEFDRTTCMIVMRRARFVPATDAAGNPVAGIYPAFKIGWARQ